MFRKLTGNTSLPVVLQHHREYSMLRRREIRGFEFKKRLSFFTIFSRFCIFSVSFRGVELRFVKISEKALLSKISLEFEHKKASLPDWHDNQSGGGWGCSRLPENKFKKLFFSQIPVQFWNNIEHFRPEKKYLSWGRNGDICPFMGKLWGSFSCQ